MSEQEVIEVARRRIAVFNALAPEEQIRRMIKKGTINEKGEVLMGLEEEKAQQAEQSDPGTAPCERE